MIRFYTLALVAVLIETQGGVIFWPVLPVLLSACWQDDPRQAYFLALFTGLLADLLLGKTLGTTAIFLLLTSSLTYFLRARFQRVLWIFLVTLVISVVFYRYVLR